MNFFGKDKPIKKDDIIVDLIIEQRQREIEQRQREIETEKQRYIDMINAPMTDKDYSMQDRYGRIPKRLLDQEICELLIRRGVHPRDFNSEMCIKFDLYNYAVQFYPPNILLIDPIYINDKMVQLYRNYEIREQMNEPPGRYDHMLPKKYLQNQRDL